ncbi:anti-repressor SinI family protein [Bacillus sp. AGMB 02131]|uniref:Anti-repressor SinI family protein n=2 Tax=Peribacillus faecalis TaxID=2772559 RepID=A0A927HBH6_9BACI|nr:anti-repressor SinI family protein [Peribacillus faecalis]
MDNQGLNQEWLKLIKQAKKAGLTKKEVRQFLLGKKNGEDLQPEVLEKVN